MAEKFDFNKIEKEKEFGKQSIKKTKEKIVFELKPEEKEFLDELLNNVYKAEIREERSDRIGGIIGIAGKLIEAEAVEEGLTILDKVSEKELISFDDYTQAYLRNSKIDIFLKTADFWKKKGKIKDADAEDKFKDIMLKIDNDMSAIFSLEKQSVQDKNLARYALFMTEENKERAYELFGKVKNKTPWLKELLDLNFQDLIQKQKADGEMIKALLKYNELELAEKCATSVENNYAIGLVANKLIENNHYEKAFSLIESAKSRDFNRAREYFEQQKLMEEMMNKIVEKRKTEYISDYLERFTEFIRNRTQRAIEKLESPERGEKERINLEAEIIIARVLRKLNKEKEVKEIFEKCYKEYQDLEKNEEQISRNEKIYRFKGRLDLAREFYFLDQKEKAEEMAENAGKSIIENLNKNYYAYYNITDYLLSYWAEIGKASYVSSLLEKFLAIEISDKEDEIRKNSVIDYAVSALVKEGNLEQAELLIQKYDSSKYKDKDRRETCFMKGAMEALRTRKIEDPKLTPIAAKLEQILQGDTSVYAGLLLIYAQKLSEKNPDKSLSILKKLSGKLSSDDDKKSFNNLRERLINLGFQLPLAEIIEEAEKKKENKKGIRPEILDIANLKNYIRNQTNKFSPVLEKLLFAKSDIYSILATYADFKENGYAWQRNKNPDIFDKRFFLLQGKFDFLAYKFLRHQSFTFRENGQPYVSDEEFGGIINSLKEEKIKTILPYLEKGDLERNYELRKLVLEYIFGPNIERKKTKEKKKMSMEKYFENIDVKKRKELRENEPEFYYQYVIYRYLKFLKWKYKAESFEDLATQLEKDKNERALFLVKEFLRIKDKSFGKNEIKLAYLGKKKEIELHQDFYSFSRFEKFKQDMDVLEKRILEEAGVAEKIIEKVKNLGKNNICLAVPNRRMAWIYEHLLPHWENDVGLFKNEEDKMLFKLESAFLSQEFNLRNQDIHLPFATVMTAQKWLSEKKIDHFVHVFKGIKYASTPTVHDRKDVWSIGGRWLSGYVQTSPEFQEPAQSIFQREALRNIADFFVNIPIVFIDITKKSEPHSFEAFRAHIPKQDRCHLMSLNTGFFRDNVLELLGNKYWEALDYGHPNTGNIADWHYFKSKKIKTTKGKKLLGEYYIEKIQKNATKA